MNAFIQPEATQIDPLSTVGVSNEDRKSMLRKAISSASQLNDYLAQGLALLAASLLMLGVVEVFSLIVTFG